ncbi:MAG: hypothetical protein IJK81_09735 [Selenomonadaceae bacterium]|nr:hypothetical protein [Selenomonadaceae bacterium]
MFKRIREKLQKILPPPISQKGQGVVEYGLILGFVAVIGVYLVSQSGIKDAVKDNVSNARVVLSNMNIEYGLAAGTIDSAEGSGANLDPDSPLPGQGAPSFP